ncbi:MAG: hypothetical protein ABJC26_01340, partial [Gemmatimonadaceae bacterium]
MINSSLRHRLFARAPLMIAAAVACTFARPTVQAQTKKSPPPRLAISPSLQSLDQWIVMRFRGAQLLPDSSDRGSAAIATQLSAPRIETSRNAGKQDTVVALHYSPTFWLPTLAAGASVQLTDPSGAVSTITGKIAARRAFRAPRVSGARDTVNAEWRIGWAYLVAIP